MTAEVMRFRYGSVELETDTPMTIEKISNLAASAKIVGIPATATITSINYRFGYGPDGKGTQISIGWRNDE